MANKGIPKFPLFDSFFQKMSCPLFGVPTVIQFFSWLSKNGLVANYGLCETESRPDGLEEFTGYRYEGYYTFPIQALF